MIIDLGLTDYLAADRIQREVLGKVKTGASKNTLILAEFTTVCTIGRKGSLGNLLVSQDFLKKEGIQVCNIDRGGDITVHNEGQLVVYPIVNLAQTKQDINWYIRSLEEVIIRLLSDYGILGERKPGRSGVWVEGKKIAFIGIAISRWTTYHGLSLNVNNDLSIFDLINPCGIKGCEITSIAKLTGDKVDMKELKERLLQIWGQFSVRTVPIMRQREDANIEAAAVA